MIKTISTPKLILFTVVSLGYYSLFWLARRRNEIVTQYKLSIPAWQWMVLPPILMMPFIVLVTFVLTLSLGAQWGLVVSLGLAILPVIAYMGVSIWWVQKFGSAVEQISGGKLPTIWTLIYWMFIGFFFAFIVQPFLNNAPAKLGPKAKPAPSRRFIRGSIIALSVASVLLAVLFSLSMLYSFNTSTMTPTHRASAEDIKRLSDLRVKTDALSRQYDSCMKKLDETYPEVTEAQHDEYVNAYIACEDVRLEQNRVAEEYGKLNTKMTLDSIFGSNP